MTSPVTTQISLYDGQSATYTLEDGVDTKISAGKIYRFVYVANNTRGDSEYSKELIAGIADKPPAPTGVSKYFTYSNATSLYIWWSSVTSSSLPIRGYILYMDDGGDF
jgi:hypothetical protein